MNVNYPRPPRQPRRDRDEVIFSALSNLLTLDNIVELSEAKTRIEMALVLINAALSATELGTARD